MIIATYSDRDTAIDILTEAFNDNQSVNYIIQQDSKRQQRIRALMAYSFDVCLLFGGIWLSEDRNACLLYLYPDRKRTTFQMIWLDLKLILRSVGMVNIFKALRREKLIGEKQLKGETLYLWFIGVAVGKQQKGIGTVLLKELIDRASAESRTITLETSVDRNIHWYQLLGFSIYDSLDLGYHLHFFKKELD